MKHTKLYNYVALLGIVIILCTTTVVSKKNVLFLISDDMRTELGVYSDSFPYVGPPMYTPQLDALSRRSLLLKRAYVQQAVCNPSRTSFLTGRRPETTKVFDMLHYWRTVGGNFTTIPQYFKDNGYATAGMGKVFHQGIASGYDDPISWTMPYFHNDLSYWSKREHTTWQAVSEDIAHAHPLPDNQIADHAVKTLESVAPKALTGEKPFFVAVGFHRPHLPFIFPEEFLKFYPKQNVSLPDNPYAPVQMPPIAWSDFDELRDYNDIGMKYGYGSINTTLPDDVVLNLRRAYYASISYIDSLVGQVITKLDSLGLGNNTVISFIGDHGWQLGEHGEWCKQTNFDIATHAPMMVHVPDLTEQGITTDKLTEFVDLFPTLVEAAGLKPLPLCPDHSPELPTCGEGVSLLPLIKDPKRSWKSAAFSWYPRMYNDGNTVMGMSMRTEQYRYTEWIKYPGWPDFPVYWNRHDKYYQELYDYVADPEGNVNKAHAKAYTKIRNGLQKQLHAGWRNALPPSY